VGDVSAPQSKKPSWLRRGLALSCTAILLAPLLMFGQGRPYDLPSARRLRATGDVLRQMWKPEWNSYYPGAKDIEPFYVVLRKERDLIRQVVLETMQCAPVDAEPAKLASDLQLAMMPPGFQRAYVELQSLRPLEPSLDYYEYHFWPSPKHLQFDRPIPVVGVKRPQGLPLVLVVTVSYPVHCGTSTSFFLFSRWENGWLPRYLDETPGTTPYETGLDNFAYAISPPVEEGRFFLVTAHSSVYCTSNWNQTFFRIDRFSADGAHEAQVLHKQDGLFRGKDGPQFQLGADCEGLTVAYWTGSESREQFAKHLAVRFVFDGPCVHLEPAPAMKPESTIDAWACFRREDEADAQALTAPGRWPAVHSATTGLELDWEDAVYEKPLPLHSDPSKLVVPVHFGKETESGKVYVVLQSTRSAWYVWDVKDRRPK
jgi:hypothetical protein